MSTKHTPAPWFTKREGFSTVYVEARIGGGWIQEVAACGPTEDGQLQQEANARLIAAAPELLEALKAVIEGCEYSCIANECNWHVKTMPKNAALEKARAAIAKAVQS